MSWTSPSQPWASGLSFRSPSMATLQGLLARRSCYVLHNVFAFTVGSNPSRGCGRPRRPRSAFLAGRERRSFGARRRASAVGPRVTRARCQCPYPVSRGNGPADTIFLVERHRRLEAALRKWFSGVFAAGSTSDPALLVVGTGRETGAQRGVGAASVRAFIVSREEIGRGELLRSAGAPSTGDVTRYDAPAVVAATNHAAVAFREAAGSTGAARSRIFVGWVEPRTGKVTTSAVPLAAGDVGKPALLLDGDTLHIVWAQRPSASAPYHLRHLRVVDGRPRSTRRRRAPVDDDRQRPLPRLSHASGTNMP